MRLLNNPRRRTIANILIGCGILVVVVESAVNLWHMAFGRAVTAENRSPEQILDLARDPFSDDFRGDEAAEIKQCERKIVEQMATLLDEAEQSAKDPQRFKRALANSVTMLMTHIHKRNVLTDAYNAKHDDRIAPLEWNAINLPLLSAMSYRLQLGVSSKGK
jgi:erythromycin esterase-like protein